MRTFVRLVAAGSLATALATVAVPGAQAASTTMYVGSAGGTTIRLLGGAVYSDPTSASTLGTPKASATVKNQVATAAVPGIASAGVVTTSVTSSATLGGTQIQGVSETASVNLLGGLIKADAVKTTGTVKRVSGKAFYSGGTQLVNLTIGGTTIPINVGVNTNITIPGVASVTLNRVAGSYQGDAYATVEAQGLHVTLLGAYGSAPAGSTIDLSPVKVAITSGGSPIGDLIGGYGTAAVAGVNLGAANATVGPLGRTAMPGGGTGGQDFVNNTAGVNLPGVVVIGAIGSTANGSVTSTASRSTESTKIAGVNLLNGLIKADVISGSVTARASFGGAVTKTATSKLVNLVIAGQVIPVNVKPNTTITIPGVLTVIINRQIRTATGITQQLLDIRILSKSLSLPAGVELQVGATNAWVRHP